jgi:hypothetical protein
LRTFGTSARGEFGVAAFACPAVRLGVDAAFVAARALDSGAGLDGLDDARLGDVADTAD